MARGALIVLEGVDRAGKSTQCRKLVEALAPTSEYFKFPDRSTEIGKTVDKYLRNEIELSDEAVHLLFSANRWELQQSIIDKLKSGINIIVDRYAFSGIAFTAAKPGFSLEWCMKPDIGLPRPDRCYYLTLPGKDQEGRGEFGAERYEKTDFQKRVADNFRTIIKQDQGSGLWKEINAAQSIEDVFQDIYDDLKSVVESTADKEIEKLWI